MHLEDLITIVVWLAASVLAVDLILISYILCRRLFRYRYFRNKERAERQFSGLIQRFLKGEATIDALVFALRTARGRAARNVIEEQLLQGLTDANRAAVTDVLFRSGHVNRWAKEAFGRRRARRLIDHIIHGHDLPPLGNRRWSAIRRMRLFCIKRSCAVARLGQLDRKFAQTFVREALLDPSPYVERADVVAMGHNRQVYEIPILVELLQKAAEGTGDLPISEIKTALARYSISDLESLVPFLDNANARFRFELTDTIREICETARNASLAAADFPDSLRRWFIDKASLDESADVRARRAHVIRHFHNVEASQALHALMADPDEFVRLHAVRACADPYYSALIGDLIHRTSDPKWRVREAAVKTLASFGEAGQRELCNHFLNAADNYASEQIAEQIQRGGMVTAMLPELASLDGKASLVAGVCSKLVRLHKTSLLSDLLLRENWPSSSSGLSSNEDLVRAEHARKARARLLEILLAEPTPQVMTAIEKLAARQHDDLSEEARSIVNRNVRSGLAATASTNGRN